MAMTDEPRERMDSTQAKLDALQQLRDEAEHAGTEQAVERQRRQGKLLARERLVALLGAVVCKREADATRLHEVRTRTGIVAAPDPCYLLLRGLKTLDLRVRRQTESAHELARRLAQHPRVGVVRYAGIGGLLSFDVADAAAARTLETSLRRITNATSLGGAETLLEARSRWEGDRVPPGLLRLSVGLEPLEELWGDLEQALAKLPDT